jgi:cell division control protein 6
MRIQDYLTESQKKITENTQCVNDFQVFDFNFIPESPLMRNEVKPIIDSLLRYEKTNIPNNLVIYGSRGSGKTLTIQYLKKVLETNSKLKVLYANCRNYNSSFKILAHFSGMKPRGASLSEVFDKFCRLYSEKTVVVLDEIDLMSDKDRNKEILYLLSRHQNSYMLVLLSNNPRFLDELDMSTRSTLQPEVLLFKNYDALQIYDILKERALKGLKAFDLESLHKISSLTYQNTNSDIRIAIKTLLYLVTESQNGLEANFERARRDIFVDLIQDLNDKNLLILASLQASDDGFVKTAYTEYLRLSAKHHEKPFSYVYFYNNLGYLQSLGLIVLISAKVDRAYTNRIRLLFNEKILEEAYQMRFDI